jgi:uncharacterized RDD family membrane protein YckC
MNEEGSPPASSSENVLGSRILAGLIDFVVVLIIGLVIVALFGESSSSEEEGVEVNLSGWPFIFFVVVALAYYFVLEATSGQTLGKRALGLKVVSLDGPLTPGKVAIRTILRLADGLFFYLVAVLTIAISQSHQRIGDMAAGTNVTRVMRG